MHQRLVAGYVDDAAFEAFVGEDVGVARVGHLHTVDRKAIRVNIRLDRRHRHAPDARRIFGHGDRGFQKLTGQRHFFRSFGKNTGT